MSDIVSSLISSANIISSPESSVSSGSDSPVESTDKQTPVVADFLELSAFFSPHANEFSPEMTAGVRSKIADINKYIGEQFPDVPNEDQVREYLADIITRNNLDKLSPSDKLDQIYNYIELSRRMKEVKDLKDRMKNLNA